MDKNFEYMIRLFAAGALGKIPDFPKKYQYNVDWNEIMQYARSQNVLQTCFLAVVSLPSEQKSMIPKAIYEQWEKTTFISVYANISRIYCVNEIIKKIQEHEIHLILLKGVTLAQYYSSPDYRISSDTDILINPKDEKRILELLKEMGFQIGLRHHGGHHTSCYKKETGIIEIHIQLFENIFEDIWFGNYGKLKVKQIEYNSFTATDGFSVNILSIQDNLKHITLHFLKHFITGHSTIRQVMDILLYIHNNFDSIDWNDFNQFLDTMGYSKIMSVLYIIGSEYFKIDLPVSNNLTQYRDLAIKLLDDILVCGLSFHEDDTLWINYCKEKFINKSGKKINYYLYMLKWRIPRIFQAMFPHSYYLTQKYVHNNTKTPPLVYLWFCNIRDYVDKFLRKEKKAGDIMLFIKKKSRGNDTVQTSSNRLEILNEFLMY